MLRTEMQIRLWEEAVSAARRGDSLAVGLRDMAIAEPGTGCGRLARALADRLEQGQSLAEAVAAHAYAFHPGTASAIQAGECAGKLPETLAQFAHTVGLERSLRLGVMEAVLYPLGVSLAAFAALLFLRVAIVPQFAGAFQEMGLNVAAMTGVFPGILLAVAAALLMFSVVLVVLFVAKDIRRLPFAAALERVRLRVPLFGAALRHALFARWCVTAGGLFAAGVPEPEAVRLAGDSTGSLEVARLSGEIAERLERGAALERELDEYVFFPALAPWMVAAARKAGGHARIWSAMARLFGEQAAQTNRCAGGLLALVLGGVAAACVGMTLAALFLPLLQLMNALGG